MKRTGRSAGIAGLGTAVPPKVLTNADLERVVDTSDEWIRTRTGIKERHVGGTTSQMAIEAGRRAIEDAGLGEQRLG